MPTVASVNPANAAVGVAVDQPVTVELTRTDSHNLVKIETTQADFAAGTLSKAAATVDGALVLGPPNVNRTENFSDPSDVVGSLPDGWTAMFGAAYTVQQQSGLNWAKHIGTATAENALRFDLYGTAADVDLRVTFTVDTTTSQAGIIGRMTGASWAAANGYFVQSQGDGATFKLQKVVAGVVTQLGSTINFAHTTGTQYKMRLQLAGTAIRCKVWLASNLEPAAWDVDATDASLSAAGYTGLISYSPTATWYTGFTVINGGWPQFGNYDFQADTIGSVPVGWTRYAGTAITVQSFGGSQVMKRNNGNQVWDSCGPDGMVGSRDIDVYHDIYFDGTHYGGVDTRFYNLGAGQCGYRIEMYNNSSVGFKYYLNGALTTIASFGVAFSASTWYRVRFQITGANPTVMRIKWWLRGNSEPAAWNYSVTDSAGPQTVTNTAQVYLWAFFACNVYWDNVVWNSGQVAVGTYADAGSRVSPAYPLSAVGKFGAGIVEYDVTLPPGAGLTVKISKDGTNWTTVASGDHIALWAEGDDLAAASIYTKAELATTDASATPALSEVRLRFLPIDSSLVEIDVDGVVHTVANGCLAIAGKTAKDVTGTITDPCHEDMTFLTIGSWQDYTPKTVTVLVKYAGATISTTTFTTLDGDDAGTRATGSKIQGTCGGMYGGFLPTAGSALDGVTGMYGGYFITELEYWYIRGEAGYLIEPPPFSSTDGQFYVAHRVMFDMAASGIVGQPSVTDVPGSGIVQAYQRADVPGSGVVLAYQQSELAASGIVAVPLNPADVAASGIVGIEQRADVPASGAVYEINANTAIDLRVISVEEAAFLDAMGMLRR